MTKIQHDYEFLTPFGFLKGKIQNRVVKFFGIRYAISARYQLPKPVSPQEAFQQLSPKPVVCPQQIYPLLEEMIQPSVPDDFVVDESCQFLSVTLPENFQKLENIPVVVWIHGGSYEIGAGDLPTSDPSVWVHEQQIVVVTVTYRLGLFGFLGDALSRPANLGLLDIIEGLKWVRQYISIFNGDPENITLLGQSSGGDAVAHLMIAEVEEPLFHKAIIQSAPLGLRKNRSRMYEKMAEKILDIKKDQTIEKLFEQQKMVIPSIKKYGWKALMPFGLQYGKSPLPLEITTEQLWRKNAKNYKVLIGLNHDETAFYLLSHNKHWLHKMRLGKKLIKQAVRFSTEKIYGRPARKFAENLALGGQDVHLFRIYSTFGNKIGAAHCFDLPLLFGDEKTWKNAGLLKEIPYEELRKQGKILRFFWADFMRTGQLPINESKPEFLKWEKILGAEK